MHFLKLIFSIERGLGYYSLETRAGYRLLIKRVEKKRRQLQNEHCCLGCFLTLTIVGIICVLTEKKHWKEKEQECTDLITLLEARLNSSGPSTELNLPAEVEARLKEARRKDNERNGNNNTADVGGACGSYYYTPAYVEGGAFYGDSAAGCGATGGEGGGGCG